MTADTVQGAFDARGFLAELAALPRHIPTPKTIAFIKGDDLVSLHFRSIDELEAWAAHVGAELSHEYYQAQYTHRQRDAWHGRAGYHVTAVAADELHPDEQARLFRKHAGLDTE